MSATVWMVRWKGSGEWMQRLRKAGLTVTELDGRPKRDERQLPAGVFRVPNTVDLADAEQRGGLR